MSTHLPVKRGISAPALNNIPDKWDKNWFRQFITQFLVDIDLRNALTSGITIAGNVSGNNSNNSGNPVTAGLSPIPNNTVLGNVSGGTATPVPLTQSQLSGITSITLGLSTGSYLLSGQAAPLLVASGTPSGYSLTAGSSGGGSTTNFGYISGTMGSISPSSLSGDTIVQLFSTSTPSVPQYSNTFILSTTTNPGQTFFTSITVGGATELSTAASYTFTGTSAQWLWGPHSIASSMFFPSTGSYSVSIS